MGSPFKVFFNINFGKAPKKGGKRKANRLTPENLEIMSRCYDEIKRANE